jgi:hypothetical protein
MHIIDSIFPSLTGNLVIGNYPHRMSREDATRLTREEKIPFSVIEMDGSEMAVIVRCHTLEGAISHHGPNRWVVFPPNFKGDSSAIYQPREVPMFWDR